jgi:hypothetical protein
MDRLSEAAILPPEPVNPPETKKSPGEKAE